VKIDFLQIRFLDNFEESRSDFVSGQSRFPWLRRQKQTGCSKEKNIVKPLPRRSLHHRGGLTSSERGSPRPAPRIGHQRSGPAHCMGSRCSRASSDSKSGPINRSFMSRSPRDLILLELIGLSQKKGKTALDARA
jgi:hypothetical protein